MNVIVGLDWCFHQAKMMKMNSDDEINSAIVHLYRIFLALYIHISPLVFLCSPVCWFHCMLPVPLCLDPATYFVFSPWNAFCFFC